MKSRSSGTSGQAIKMNTRISSPVKLCFIAYKAYPVFNQKTDKIFGGAEVDLYLIASEIAKDPGFDVSFIVGNYGQSSIETRENVRLIRSVDVNSSFILQSGKILDALKKADADIYMSEARSLGVALYAWFCRKNRKVFVYRTAHSLECDGTYCRKSPLKGAVFKWALRRADHLLTQNRQDKEGLKENFNLEARIVKNSCRMPHILSQKRGTILWVGRSAAIKRPYLFLKLAKEFPENHFTMICPRTLDDNKYHLLKEQAAFCRNVLFVPQVPFDTIDEYFLKAKLFVNTSRAEGFPNTFVQACKCRTPILSLKANPDNFLLRYECGLCASDDWNCFTRQFQKLCDTDIAFLYGENGYQYAKKNHDISQIIKQEFKS